MSSPFYSLPNSCHECRKRICNTHKPARAAVGARHYCQEERTSHSATGCSLCCSSLMRRVCSVCCEESQGNRLPLAQLRRLGWLPSAKRRRQAWKQYMYIFLRLACLLGASPLHRLDNAYCSLTAFSVSRSCLKLKDLGNDQGISFAQSCFFNYNSFLPDLLLRRFA